MTDGVSVLLPLGQFSCLYVLVLRGHLYLEGTNNDPHEVPPNWRMTISLGSREAWGGQWLIKGGVK